MKYPLTFLLMLLCSSSISAQDRYFHDLKGLEDSTDVTQLFYRLSESPDEDNDSSNFRYNKILQLDQTLYY